MAKDMNSGAERLTGRILELAREEASKTAEAALAQAEKIRAKAAEDAGRLAEEYDKKAEKAENDIMERSRTNAELDARKYALAAKRELIDEAFRAALAGLCALDGSEREELFKSLVLRSAYGAETLRPAAADAALAARLLGGLNEELAAAGKKPIAIGEPADIKGGCLLIGEGYEMNCSFEALLDDLREREEGSVSKLLFG